MDNSTNVGMGSFYIINEDGYSERVLAEICRVLHDPIATKGFTRDFEIPAGATVALEHGGFVWSIVIPTKDGEINVRMRGSGHGEWDPPTMLRCWWRISVENGDEIHATQALYGLCTREGSPRWTDVRLIGLLSEKTASFFPGETHELKQIPCVFECVNDPENSERMKAYFPRSKIGFQGEVREWRRAFAVKLLGDV